MSLLYYNSYCFYIIFGYLTNWIGTDSSQLCQETDSSIKTLSHNLFPVIVWRNYNSSNLTTSNLQHTSTEHSWPTHTLLLLQKSWKVDVERLCFVLEWVGGGKHFTDLVLHVINAWMGRQGTGEGQCGFPSAGKKKMERLTLFINIYTQHNIPHI